MAVGFVSTGARRILWAVSMSRRAKAFDVLIDENQASVGIVVITDDDPVGLAQRADLRPNDVIVSINDEAFANSRIPQELNRRRNIGGK